MAPRLTPVWLLLGLVAALASGCGSSNPTAPIAQTDQSLVNSTLSASASLVDDNLAESALKGSATQEFAAITPYKWWQSVTSVTKTWTLAFSDTDGTGHPNTCLATVNTHVTGHLVIVPLSDTTTTITKPLDKTLTRQVLLQRLLINGSRFWKIVEVTGALVTTPAPNNTSHIVSIHIVATGVDTTLTDPTGFFSLKHIIRFAASDTIHLTVTTSRNTDPVFIHLNGIYRWRLHNNLDNTYSTHWVTSALGGWRHFGIQVMTRASLYDDTAPFDTQAWHFPFRVMQGDVDYYP
jgi:hypothetical protein